MVTTSLRGRVARLKLYASDDALAKVRLVEWVKLCCDHEASSTDEPGEHGSIGTIVIRSATRAKYCEIRDQLASEGLILLEG